MSKRHDAPASEKENNDADNAVSADTVRNGYWENITSEPASGYKKYDDADNILSEDQRGDDNERGDKKL